MENNWITLPSGFSLNANSIRAVSMPTKHNDYIEFIIYYQNKDHQRDMRFEFKKYVETPDELLNKVTQIRNGLVKYLNDNKEPFVLLAKIDLKKKEVLDSTPVTKPIKK